MQLPIKIIVPSEETFDKACKSGRGYSSSHVFFALDWQEYESEVEACPLTTTVREVLDKTYFCMHIEHVMQLGHLMHAANETEETLPIPRADTMVREASLKVRNAYLRTAFDLLYDSVHGVVSIQNDKCYHWGRIALCRFLYPLKQHRSFDIAFDDLNPNPKRKDEILEGFQACFQQRMDERKRKASMAPVPADSQEVQAEIAKLREMLEGDIFDRNNPLLACVSDTINQAFASSQLGIRHYCDAPTAQAFSRFFDVFMSVVRSKERIFPESTDYEHIYKAISEQVNKVRRLLDKEQEKEKERFRERLFLGHRGA